MKIAITLTSSLHVGQEYIDLTSTIAEHLAQRKHSIVYGGTEYGMMKILAQSYKKHGHELIGVMSHELANVTLNYKAYEDLDQAIWTDKMSDRTRTIFDLSDGVLILPGGYGTLEEIGVYIGAKVNKIADKPIVIFNYKGFYTDLISMFNTIFEKQFSKIGIEQFVKITDSIEEALDYLENYQNVHLPDKFST